MHLTQDQRELYDFMSEISETSYCAGWMEGTEFRLWDFMTNADDDGDWGLFPIPQTARERLMVLARRVDGWTYFAYEPDNANALSGPTFVTTSEWLDILAARPRR